MKCVSPEAKRRLERPVSRDPARGRVDCDAGVAARVREVGEVGEDQGAVRERLGGLTLSFRRASIGREREPVQCRMVRDGHLGPDGRVERDGEIAGACLHRAVDPLGGALCLGEVAVVQIVSGAACLREEREVA